jgi:chemotaxis protein histidine kinase CheA
MVTETDQTSEVTTEVPEQTSQETQVDSTSEATKEVAAQDSTKGEQVEKPAYTPNYKLKVYDEEKELEDKFLKDLIKDPESEKKVKEIAQKYLGFDTVKSRHEKVKSEYQTFKEQAEPVVEYYNYAQNLLASKNYDDFFELIKLPKEEIFSWAVKKAQEAQLPPEERARIEHQKKLERERSYLENQTHNLQAQQQQQLAQFRAQELEWVMQRPDVNNVAKMYDAKNGPGSFKMLVRDKGLAHFAATNGKEDLSAEQAVSEVMKLLSPFVNQTNASATPGAGMAPQAPLIPQNGAPPIIPNAAGKGSSPVKKQYRSIADLKKRSEELQSSS